MSQKTLVIRIPSAGRAALERRLRGGEFEWRNVPHAVFSVKGDGAVATLYSSGKLVVQGADPALFLARYTDLEVPVDDTAEAGDRASAGDGVARLDGPTVGSDEAGKGDYFGPLVVAAVLLEPETAQEFTALGVTDSKRLSDDRALALAALLRRLPHSIQRLDPPDYNEAHGQQVGGLNRLLAGMHAEAIRAVARPGVRVLVDQFAHESLVQRALEGADVRLEQATRAERNTAVAAASVLARAEFLLALRELSQEWGQDLHKGAGFPTDASGVRFAREHGIEALGRVAKVHFKNTGKIRARLGR